MSKGKLKEIIRELLKRGAQALVKLVKSKLLPRAEEKYCEALQATADKLSDKAIDRVEELNNETDNAKKIKKVYLLKLIAQALEAVDKTIDETVKYIRENVDFGILENPSEETLVALAEIPGALDNDEEGGCGPDGCEIV